jgi:ribosomal protein S18 acetylase RimI-like enzyme
MTRIEIWDPATFERNVDAAMAIYVAAMGYPAFAGAQRGRAARGQTTFPQFSARAAVEDDGRLIGFGYGYTSEDGQWWHELVRRAVPDDLAATWLEDAFELSELHVLPAAQGRGIGQALLTSLAEGLPHKRMLLSTPDGDTRAFRLYRRLGFVDLARAHYFPGELRPFAVLGAELPFAAG